MKIHNDRTALDRALQARNFARVVFTNGVYDILHPGHIELLHFARSAGDALVVGINSDLSVKRLKGKKRPVFGEAERLEVLAAIADVDYVITFDEDTPLELLTALTCVNVLVKGGDYQPQDVVGRDLMQQRAGELLLFPFKSGYSTSAIIQKILSGTR
jgi:D-beta-D-heptose 7-phosphate kinase / D-beta-D-heptose 1-phosphate adenosyltransferase